MEVPALESMKREQLVTNSFRSKVFSKIRVIQFIACFGILSLADALAGKATSPGWWWIVVSAVTAVGVTLLEPQYTSSKAALGNIIGGFAAFATVDRNPIQALWYVYAAFLSVVLVTSVLDMTISLGRAQPLVGWISRRAARVRTIGFLALALEVLRVATKNPHAAVTLALGLAAAALVALVDWTRVLNLLPANASLAATIELAMEPNLLLLATSMPLRAGMAVRVKGNNGSCSGTVLTPLAHRLGTRFQIVLQEPWWTVTTRSNSICSVEILEESDVSTLGFAAEGSTERTIEVHPVTDLTYGKPLLIRGSDQRDILYQVSALRLERRAWDNSSVIEPRATAVQVGSINPLGELSFEPYLPRPYQVVVSPSTLEVNLPTNFKRIGVIEGTAIEIGLDPHTAKQSHLAVLGMSGMGKTTLARRLSSLLSGDAVVIAVDGTGEYRSRLGFPSLPAPVEDNLSTLGEWVLELRGEPAGAFSNFLRSVMTTASLEYEGLGPITSRVLLLEEAHSFLPEWNFASRTQQDPVNQSCRFILQARKFGLSFIFVSQRTAVISKSALSQCESYVIFRTLDQTSLDYIESVVGKEMRAAVSSLRRYQAICVGPAFNTSSPVIVSVDEPLT